MVHSNRDATAPIPGEPQQDTANPAGRRSLHVSSRGLSPDPDSGCGRGVTPDLDRGVALRTMRPPFRGPLEGRTQAQDSTRHLLTLSLIPGLTARAIAQLAQRAPLAEVLAHPDEHADLVPETGRAALRSGRAAARAEQESAAAARLGIALIALADPRYPALLRRIYDPPPVLYVRGARWPRTTTRRRSPWSDRAPPPPPAARWPDPWPATSRPGAPPSSRAWPAASTPPPTRARSTRPAAPWPCWAAGLDRIYPPENERLAGRIAFAGAVVSEFALGTPPLPEHFPRRNRVIAGWSRAVVVVEAAAPQRRAQHRPLRGRRGARRPGRSGPSHPARVRGHQPADPGRRRPRADGARRGAGARASTSRPPRRGARRPPAGRPRRRRPGDPGGAARSQRP